MSTGTPGRAGFVNVGGSAPAYAALVAMTRSFSAELGAQGVRAVCLMPNAIPETATIAENFERYAKGLNISRAQFQAQAGSAVGPPSSAQFRAGRAGRCRFPAGSIVAGRGRKTAMPDFMLLIHENEASGAALAPRETRALLERQASYAQQLRAAVAYLDGERLRPSAEGRRVSRGEEGPRVEVGPFADPTLGGYYVLRAASLEAALELAEQCPAPPGAEREVRPLMKGHFEPDKTSERGRVFAFGVLGSAPHEQAWIDVMDRIDERTHDQFPAEQFRGGVRLEAPGRGRRLSSTGGRRAVFDGPFLESKEVIGGLFFMRMANLDEAVQWANQSAFVDYGTLEIRELWRS